MENTETTLQYYPSKTIVYLVSMRIILNYIVTRVGGKYSPLTAMMCHTILIYIFPLSYCLQLQNSVQI